MKRNIRRGAWLRALAWIGTLLVVAWILSLTLVEHRQPGTVNLVPFSQKLIALDCLLGACPYSSQRRRSAIFLFVDVLGNVAVFVLFGAMFAVATFPQSTGGRGARGRRFGAGWWMRVTAAGFLFSLTIEIAQLFMRTRTTDIDDVILNTLGALIGAAIVRAVYALKEVLHD